MIRNSRNYRSVLILPVLACGLLSNSASALSQPLPCIVISEIEESSVLSNRLIGLRMRDGRSLRLRLDDSCTQLKFHKRFAYRAQGGQLCAGRDMLIARSGEPCRILDIEASAGSG